MESLIPAYEDAVRLLVECLKTGGQVLICGNGGSASDGLHFAGELVGRFLTERRGLPAIALSAGNATFTAIANDYGYDEVFARQVNAYGNPGDVLFAFSTSGNSKNVLLAAEAARDLGMQVVGMTAQSGGHLESVCDACLKSPTPLTYRAQEIHIMLIHMLCGEVDRAFADE